MKKLLIILLAMVMVCALAACSQPPSEPDKTVVFADPLLEEMVRAAMNKPEGDITLAEAEAVTELQLGIDWQPQPAPNTQITDISGLEHFINLEDLNLSFHAITDISPLAGLTKLTQLSLGGNPVADISPLAGLTNLEFLPLFNCQATDYSPLANLTKLGGLLLDHSTISDVSVLSGLTELWWLGLANTQVSDVSPLAGLTNLRQLQLAGCPITDYTPLAAIYPNLEEKDFSLDGSSEQPEAAEQPVASENSLMGLGFGFDDAGTCGVYEQREPHYASVAITRPEWGEHPDGWDIELSDSDVNGYTLIMWYYADEGKWMISIEGDNGGKYDYYPATGKHDVHAENVPQVFNAVFGTQGDGFRDKPLAHFEQWIMKLFGKSIDELYALPKQ
ncbi:MAG: leucine-rich repeat domain-containing protein [Lachnospiraceae bacterium]|jgi:hypothetical protein